VVWVGEDLKGARAVRRPSPYGAGPARAPRSRRPGLSRGRVGSVGHDKPPDGNWWGELVKVATGRKVVREDS
jgi:hypothetical protein